MSDLAHLGPVELFTPRGEESLAFFVDVMGMEVEAPGRPVDLPARLGRLPALVAEADRVATRRAWACSGCAPGARRRCERRVAAVEATGLGEGWTDGDLGRGPSYRFRDPDGHVFELYYECERYDAAAAPAPALKNVPGRYTGRGCAIKRLDHVNVLAADVRANREFCVDALGYRLYERIELDDGSEAGAWMSADDRRPRADLHARRARRRTAACTTSRSGSTRARSACAPPTSGSTPAIEIEAAPSKHAIAQGFFLYGIEPGGNRVEVTTGGRFVYAPDEPCVVWTEAERAKGQAWGVQTVETFHTYGTPPV